MISDVDWELLERRLQSIERSIEMLKAMVPEKPPSTQEPTDLSKWKRPYGALSEIPCVFDNMSESEKMKPLCISCPCPKCSPYALSYGSLQDSGTKQVWRNKDES